MALPDETRAELHEGELVMLASPDGSHQALLGRLYTSLCNHFGSLDRVLMAPADVVFDDTNTLQPDVLVFPEGTRPQAHPWKYPHPIWVAEILSPSTASRDRGIKLDILKRFGVPEAWLIDQFGGMIAVHDLAAGSCVMYGETDVAKSRVIAGFELAVGPYLSFPSGA